MNFVEKVLDNISEGSFISWSNFFKLICDRYKVEANWPILNK